MDALRGWTAFAFTVVFGVFELVLLVLGGWKLLELIGG